MLKSKKIVLTTCIALAILLFALIYGIGKILTTNFTKEFIIQKLEAATGYEVSIDDQLQWHYTLHPNLDIKKITFRSQEKIAIQLERVNISMALLPLLQKRFDVSLKFQRWKQNQLLFSRGTALVAYENNVLTLSDFDADFYEGHLVGNALINLNNKIPKFNISLKATQVEVSHLLKDIANATSVSGKMDVSAHLKSAGSDVDYFIRNLSGNINASIKNGKLHTIHLSKIIPYITSNISKKQADIFDTLKIQDTLIQGVANSTIQLFAKNYKAEGLGKIDLNAQTLDLKLEVYYTQSNKTKHIAIPIYIQGPMSSPKMSTDLRTPANQLLNTNKDKLMNTFQKLIN